MYRHLLEVIACRRGVITPERHDVSPRGSREYQPHSHAFQMRCLYTCIGLFRSMHFSLLVQCGLSCIAYLGWYIRKLIEPWFIFATWSVPMFFCITHISPPHFRFRLPDLRRAWKRVESKFFLLTHYEIKAHIRWYCRKPVKPRATFAEKAVLSFGVSMTFRCVPTPLRFPSQNWTSGISQRYPPS